MLGFMEATIPYSSIEDVNIISRWDAGQKFCIRITVGDGSVLLQVSTCTSRLNKKCLCLDRTRLNATPQCLHSTNLLTMKLSRRFLSASAKAQTRGGGDLELLAYINTRDKPVFAVYLVKLDRFL